MHAVSIFDPRKRPRRSATPSAPSCTTAAMRIQLPAAPYQSREALRKR